MFDNPILTMIKIISALFFENIAEDNAPHVKEELQQALASIPPNKNTSAIIGTEDAAEQALRYTAEWMLCNVDAKTDGGEDLVFSRDNIIKRLSVNLHCDNQYIEIAKSCLDETVSPADARKRVNEIMSELRFTQRQQKMRLLIAKAHQQINFNHDPNSTAVVQGLLSELESLQTNPSGEPPGFVGSINFGKRKEIEAIMQKNVESYSPQGILRMGFQGFGRAMGVGGYRRGELVNYAGLTHHYKSGKLLDDALFIPVYNDPWMWDENKKPMILRISFENTPAQDVGIMYKKLHEIRFQERCNIADVNIEKASKTLYKHFSQRGYHFDLVCCDPNNFSIFDLFDLINRYIADGFEIHAITCDYITLIAHNTYGDRLDSKIQKTYEMIRNFCFPKGITFITAHQLSTEAQNLSRESASTFTKKVCQGGWYMDCRSLHTKLDLEFVMHIVPHIDGNKYLTVSRGKHRGGESTPLVDQHFCYKFQEFGGLVPDEGSDDMSLRKLPEMLDPGAAIDWD